MRQKVRLIKVTTGYLVVSEIWDEAVMPEKLANREEHARQSFDDAVECMRGILGPEAAPQTGTS